MDAFDAVRRSAALLHDAAVRLGADPCSPTAVVRKAAELLDLAIVEIPLGSAALYGALALFDAQAKHVCCKNEGSEIERALLIAHELGHARLHTGESRCAESDIDGTASIEPTPVGLERVTDYGARERRELHANVFARELVLPMHLARQLFLDDRLSARAIAERTGLALGLVQQQVLDAVLLPTPPEIMETERVEPDLDPSQEAAAHHKDSAYNLQAGPGTGKTRTLVERVRWLLDQGADPTTILVLTFSNRAANELSERFAAALPDAATRIWTGTFHAFGLDLIRRFSDRFERTNNPRLFDRSDAIAALQDVLPTLPLKRYRYLWNPAYPLREILASISRAKDEVVDCKRYRELAAETVAKAKGEKEIEVAEKCMEVAEVYELYETVLREQNAVDFGDLIMRPTFLLESEPALRAQLNERHRYVLVDEFQDVNRASARLLKAISGDASRLWVVGDARQSIYRFRGASPANLQSFHKDFGGEAGALAVNYRSTEQIVRAVCAVAPHLKASEGQLPLDLKANRGQGPGPPEIRAFSNPEAEAAGIVDSVLDLQKHGVALRDQAVLCRSNARLAAIAKAFEVRGVPVLHLGSLFERDDVRDLLALLSLSVDKFSASLVRVGALPRYGLSLQDVYIAVKWLKEKDSKPLEMLAACAREATGLSTTGVAGLARLAEDLDGLSQSVQPWDYLCAYLLDRTDFVRDIARDASIGGQMKGIAIWQFMNFVHAPVFQGTGSPVRRVLDRVRELVLLAEERGLREVPSGALHLDAVRLMTIHGSKGLEFEAVHLPALTQATFPVQWSGERYPTPRSMIERLVDQSDGDPAKADHAAEEDCLFFVALSRSKTYARLYRYENSAGGKSTAPSRFIGWLTETGLSEMRSRPAQAITAATSSALSVYSEVTKSPSLAALVLYEQCPRRYFYTHVLELGTARRQTAFSRTHTCIQKLIAWYANPENAGASRDLMQAALDDLWESSGPTDHPAAAEFRALAMELADSLLQIAPSGTAPKELRATLTFPTGTVTVEEGQIAHDAGGRAVVRRFNTGRKRKDEYDRLEYAAYRLAAEQNAAALEAVFLTNGVCEPVPKTSDKVFGNRKTTIEELLGNIRDGEFDAKPDTIRCPNCPHFFVCDAVPEGELKIS
jgi:superfamily I DNA/RNA helicase